MGSFAWQGLQGGRQTSGEIAAESLDEAKALLADQGIMLTGIEGGDEVSTALKKPYRAGKIKKRELMIFSKKFATMVEAGLPILKTLQMLHDQAENKHFKQVIGLILKDVEAGSTLSGAFAKHDRVFDTIYINLLRAGEESGKLTLFLKRLVVHIEKAENIRRKVKGALMYPCILLTVALAVIIIMLVKVVPVFQKMFASMGNSLPGPTQLIVNVSAFVRDPAKGGTVAIAVIVSFIVLKYLIRTSPKVRRKVDAFSLKLPVIGQVIRMSVLSKIAMVEGNLSAAGVSVLESLDIIKSTLKNSLYRDVLDNVKQGINEGKTLSALYGEYPALIPPTFSQMLAVGEETGNMDEMFAAIAGYYEEEFDEVVGRLTELMEPFMIVFMGATVGFIIVAMYMPIFSIGKAVSGGH